jgi:translation elongation factor EF-1alpha
MKKKKPDLVVWDENKGYYQRELTYGSNQGAPAIKLENVTGWKESQILSVNKQFKSRYEELKEEFQKLVNEVNYNELVYSSNYSFIPVVGETYYLYSKDDGTTFMSLISPEQWNQKHLGTFKLDSTNKWVKLN